MTKITVHEGDQIDALKEFKEEQWPIADKEHYGDKILNFSNPKYTILAKEDDQIVGFICMEIDMGVAIINDLLVHNEFQRKGIASALMQKAEEKAKEEECHILKLETGDDWGAKNFYETQGYTVIANLKQYYDKRDFVLMEKRIENL